MFRPARAVLCLTVLTGCEAEFNISGDPVGAGAGDAPSLTTPIVTDKLVQTPESQADILFVIDNSPTMDDDQRNLFRNFPVMMDFLLQTGLDFHVGVTSTNKVRAGKLYSSAGEDYITPNSPDPTAEFVDMAGQIPRSPGAANNESGIATTFMALNDTASDFLRPGAGLHVVVMSDEDDQSGGNPITRTEFISYLQTLPQDPDAVTFSSIVCQRGDSCLDNGGSVGDNYMAVSNAVGGVVWPINDDDYTDALELLAMQAAGLRDEFFLTQLPVPGTVKVRVKEAGAERVGVNVDDIPAGSTIEDVCAQREDCVSPFPFTYTVERNSVSLNDWVPDPFAKVTIEYESLADQQPESETQP